MNPPILNRAAQLPTDGWYEIETPGEHVNRQAGVVQVLDGQAFDAIVNRFRAEAAAPNFAGLLIDRDHFSLDPEQTSESFGWLMELRNREGHLEGRIDWSDTGEAAVRGKRFKFFSTVYESADCEQLGARVIKNGSFSVVRPLRLDRLALTNDPNNKGGKPISNRNGNDAGAGNHEQEPTMKNIMKQLGLAEDAPEASATAEILKIQNRATTAEAKVTQLQTERDGLLAVQVDADLEKFAPVIKNRDTVKKQLLANRAGTIELLEALQAVGPEKKAPPAPITNRAAAAVPGAAGADKKADEDGKLAAKISNRALEIQKQKSTRGRTYAYQSAFNDARAELAAGQ